jgi:hypothetical protein
MSQGTHSLCEHRHHEERNPFMWCFMMVHIDFTQKLQTTSLLRLILSNLQSGTHSLFTYHTSLLDLQSADVHNTSSLVPETTS